MLSDPLPRPINHPAVLFAVSISIVLLPQTPLHLCVAEPLVPLLHVVHVLCHISLLPLDSRGGASTHPRHEKHTPLIAVLHRSIKFIKTSLTSLMPKWPNGPMVVWLVPPKQLFGCLFGCLARTPNISGMQLRPNSNLVPQVHQCTSAPHVPYFMCTLPEFKSGMQLRPNSNLVPYFMCNSNRVHSFGARWARHL